MKNRSQACPLSGGHNGDSLEPWEQRAIDGLVMLTSSPCVKPQAVGKPRSPALREQIKKSSSTIRLIGNHRRGAARGSSPQEATYAQPCCHQAMKFPFPVLFGLCLSVLFNTEICLSTVLCVDFKGQVYSEGRRRAPGGAAMPVGGHVGLEACTLWKLDLA